MGMVLIQDDTTINPLELIGREAGVCYGSDISDEEKNIKRGLECIKNKHDRCLEFPQIYMILDGYSARVMREFYTHNGGDPTRLQSSTRYVKYGDFDFVVPESIKRDEEALEEYTHLMCDISETYKALKRWGVPQEDAANVLPLGMLTKVVVRTNLRNLIDMSHQRLCTRAYWEYRALMNDIIASLKRYSIGWEKLIDSTNLFVPKCEFLGYCPESKSCGRMLNET